MNTRDLRLETGNCLVLGPGEGQALSFLGVTVALKAAGADTGGAWSVAEYTAPPRFAGPAPHFHRQMDEAYYILEGSPTFQLGEQLIRTRPGTFIFVERGTVHTFLNPEPEPARFLVFISPAGFEGYWLELAELIRTEPSWPPSDTSMVAALAQKYDQHPPHAKGA